ncbi:histidine kinase [Anaeromyxobacter dehalogenans 2CP-1]|uniref:histidine kinase n=1 Tax=Anaeromyxobacter dehalogenans (strain ATCC BAA-258 / DSM 21875 / 2CP-1) TaxID=455488 RepID=B8J698_ANAD2|nr:hybrid sensor histidine kinase/response regulator [Anaeromyxobacter dehalogenans]ACL65079.1 histidine kinase [Anaeromyxobacter dehalogenans 2CP-1]
MVTVGRRLLVPTTLLAAVACAALAYAAWSSAQQARTLERDARAVRTAISLAFALGDATHEEERWFLTLPRSPGGVQETRLDEAGARIAGLMREIEALPLPARVGDVWREYVEVRAAQDALGAEIRRAAPGGGPALERALERWGLMSFRSEALLKDVSGYYLRFLDRIVVELQARRARALWISAATVVVGLLAAAALSLLAARAVVRPLEDIARTAERIAETSLPAEVAGAERPDEIGTLSRAFNRMTGRLVSANARLTEIDRRKDEFLGMLSHELRNPLAPIRSALHLLSHPAASPAQGRRALQVIARQVDHLTRIVDDLLDVTRIARGKIELRRERIDLSEVIARTAEDYRDLLDDRRIALEVELSAGPLWADADPTRVAQVVGNLLSNAAKFTPPGGRVTVRAAAREGRAVIRVIDTGVGMPPELLGRIFEPFVQADRSLARSAGGLGLGLSLVKGIVELHGGAVEARSAGPGTGSELVIELPLAAGGAEPLLAPPAAPAGAAGPRRVLVVDDNVDAAETLAELLRHAGHEVAIAHDGPGALAAARAGAPDVVLCDIGLPGMSGYDVARALRRERGPGLLLVAISGYALPEDVHAAHEAGFDRHLAKPPRPDEVERAVASPPAGIRAGAGG